MALKITNDQYYGEIADAIRTKLSTSDTYLPSEMADAIESIEVGAATEVPTIFVDYEGTILYEYTQDEIQALSSLPALPTRNGLTAQEWNWTLSDLQLLSKPAVVGVNYVTSDGKTRVYVSVPATDKTLYTKFQISTGGEVVINWGDGNTDTCTDRETNILHTYSSAGDYVITYEATIGTFTVSGSHNNGSKFIWSNQSSGIVGALKFVKKIELGTGIVLSNYCCSNMNFLESITIPSTLAVPGFAFVNCDMLGAVVVPKVNTVIDSSTFNCCRAMKRVSIPNGITLIGSNSFEKCYALERICLPNTVTTVNGGGLLNCHSIVKLDIPSGLTTIGQDAFNDVTGFASNFTVPSGISVIEKNAFLGTDFEQVTINGTTSIKTYAFSGNKKLKKVIINGNIAELGEYAFSSCERLETITIPGSITSFEKNLFSGCKALKSFVINNAVTTIKSYVFNGCELLSNINIPSAVTSILANAFYGCTDIQELTIPSGVTTVEAYSFASMKSLSKITFLGDITSIGANAFNSSTTKDYDFTHCTTVPTLANANAFSGITARTTIKVPAALYDTWIASSVWSNLATYIVSA